MSTLNSAPTAAHHAAPLAPRTERLSSLHTRQIPALRMVGLSFGVAAVALHDLALQRTLDWTAWAAFAVLALAYGVISWWVLRRWYRPDAPVDLAVLFLTLDLIPMGAAVYLTGADRSWIFWVFLLRVADQTTTTFRRAMAFSLAGPAAYLAVVAYATLIEGRPVAWTWEAAKVVFLLLSGIYISLGARLAERLRKRLADALRTTRQSAAELAEQSRELERARARAEAASRAKSEFLSRVSHELRTPMNAIMGFGQLLELEKLSPEQHAYVREMLDSGRHLLDVINEVLDIARVESGALARDLEPVHLGRALDEVLEQARHDAERNRVALPAELPPETDAWVMGTDRKIRHVFANLISNAVKYNSSPGRVTIDCRTEADRIRVSITDTGAGVAPEQVEAAFAPFTRLDTAEGSPGTGLGLAVSRSLTTAMGGTVGADTRPGQGSTFWVELELTAAPRAEKGDPTVESGAGPLVLYIEDRPENVSLMRRVLARRPAIRLASAPAGLDGLEAVRAQRPDLVLLDLELPDIAGAEVLARLREDPATRDIPVVVVSAEAAPAHVERILAAGARAYFTMPYDVVEFLDVVDDALAPAGPAGPAAPAG